MCTMFIHILTKLHAQTHKLNCTNIVSMKKLHARAHTQLHKHMQYVHAHATTVLHTRALTCIQNVHIFMHRYWSPVLSHLGKHHPVQQNLRPEPVLPLQVLQEAVAGLQREQHCRIWPVLQEGQQNVTMLLHGTLKLCHLHWKPGQHHSSEK